MFKKIQKHLLLALIFFTLTLVQQYGFFYFKNITIVWLSVGKYLGVFAFLFGATFIRPYWMRYLFLGFIFLLNTFQMGHLSYFGTQILPNEYILFLTQFDEIKGTLLVEYEHTLVPLIFTLIPAIIGWFAVKKYKDLYGSNILGILFCLYFIYNPVRTFVTGNTWGRQPSTRELTGMNVYLSFSYFLGKILPYKITDGIDKKATNSSTELKLTKSESEWDKVILVLGESLSPAHMGLYGYEKPTTPFLTEYQESPFFYKTVALSGGVSTDVALAFFLNMGFGDAGSGKASKGEHCIFKLAKESGFDTSFLSIQSSDQLRYITPYLCASSLDEYKTLEDIAPQTIDHQAALDVDLLTYLEKIIGFDKKQFIVLHQRGSHAPWEVRSQPKNRTFPHEDKINHYDNSVIEFDHFMAKLTDLVNDSKKKVIVIYVSDHGESLGQDGKWGHGHLVPSSFEVPLIVQTFNAHLPQGTRNWRDYTTHYNVGLYLAEALGHKPNQSFTDALPDYEIFGNDIDGFAGKIKVNFRPNGTYDWKVIR